jgi:hypothetical protein
MRLLLLLANIHDQTKSLDTTTAKFHSSTARGLGGVDPGGFYNGK